MSCSFSRAHRGDYCCSAGYGIAARIYARDAGLAGVFFHEDAAPLLGLKASGGGLDQGVGRGAQGHDHAVHGQRWFQSLLQGSQS